MATVRRRALSMYGGFCADGDFWSNSYFDNSVFWHCVFSSHFSYAKRRYMLENRNGNGGKCIGEGVISRHCVRRTLVDPSVLCSRLKG